MTAPTEEGTVELQPCPFCGLQDAMVTSEMDNTDFRANCLACEASGPAKKNTSKAIAAWNRRASRSPVVGAVGGEPTDKEAHEPYLCIAPACGKDCSGCNSAISPADMRKYAVRYAWLRSDDIEVPQGQREIVVQMLRLPFREDQSDETLFGRELDEAIDAAMGGIGVSPTGSPEGEVK